MRIELTEKAVAKLKAPHPSGKQTVVRDAAMIGFGILLSGKTAAKSWIVERRGCPRRTIERVGVMSLDEAREVGAKWLALMNPKREGGAVDPKKHFVQQQQQRVTLKAALAIYLEDKTNERGNLREVSKKYYRQIIQCHLSDWLDTPIDAITAQQVQQRHSRIFKNNGGPIAGMVMKVLRAVMHFNGVSHELVSEALKGRWAPKVKRNGEVADAELPPFWQAVQTLENPLHRVAITLMLFCGLRVSEVIGLRWEELELEAGTLTLPPSRCKAGREFVTPLSSVPLAALRELREVGRDRSGFCFPNAGSRSGHIGPMDGDFARLSKVVGHPLTRHDLRRTFATLCHESGAGDTDRRRLTNHAVDKDDEVADGYVQRRLPHLRRVQERAGAYILARCLGQAPEPDETEVLRAQVAELKAALAQRGRARAA